MKRFLVFLLVCLGTGLSAPAEQLASRTRGLSADSIYQVGDLDNINLFNGNLTLAIPIGQTYPVSPQLSYRLSLVYNSNVWDYEDELVCLVDNQPRYYNFPFPAPSANAGVGWSLHFGRLFAPNDPIYNKNNGSWLFVDTDGSQHNFYSQLHPTEPATANIFYSLDGTYLRLNVGTSSALTIESPDGLKRTFSSDGAGRYRLTEIKDRFANWMRVAYTSTTWTITDSHGRSHAVTLTVPNPNPNAGLPQVVTKVELEAFGGSTATYNLNYTTALLERHRYVPEPCESRPEFVEAPMLDKLVMPGGSAFFFTYDSDDSGFKNFSGALRMAILPTRGRIEWDYATYSFQSQANTFEETSINRNRGIGERRTYLNATTSTQHGRWTYDYSPGYEVGPGGPFRVSCWHRMRVSDSLSHLVTDSYFATAYGADSWWYGLPYAPCDPVTSSTNVTPWSSSNDTPHLSTQIFEDDGAGNLTLKRSTYVIYDSDGPNNGDRQDRNHRVRYQKVVYADDLDENGEPHYEETISSDFDGLGHYRSTSRKSSFGPEKVLATTYVPAGTYQLNPDTSVVIADPFSVPSTSSPWILGLSTGSTTTQGTAISKRETCYDATTGFLERQRVFAGAARQTKDVVVEFAEGDDEDGNAGFVVAERVFGGDNSATVPSGELCGLTLSSPAFVQKSSYRYGSRTRAVLVEPCAETTEVLVTEEAEIDQSTGLPEVSIESNGLRVALDFDSMSRLIAEVPDEGASRIHQYVLPTEPDFDETPSYEVRQCPQGTSFFCNTSARLSDRYWSYDGLGRMKTKALAYPAESGDAQPSVSYTLDGLGRKTEETTWGGAHHTTFGNFDIFGRARSISPQGTESTLLTFLGERIKAREVKVATSEGGTSSVFNSEKYDHLGRLVAVCDGGTAVWDDNDACTGQLTRYDYDQDDRLIQVCQNVQANGTCGQTRSFNWDGRGFLVAETHPELGASGNGTIVYQRDARGNPTYRDIQNDTGDRPLRWTYDRAGRPTLVEERQLATSAWRKLKEFFYARENRPGSSEKRRGQLIMARRTNWVTLLDPLSLLEGTIPLTVTDHYEYFGISGRASKKTTSISLPSGSQSWTTSFAYDSLGELSSLSYPSGDWPHQTAPARQVGFSRRLGFLTSISGYADSITYQLGGMLYEIDYPSGVKWRQTPEAATGWERPSKIEMLNGAGQASWSTGTYSYDGVGNLSAIGERTYVYDRFSRLSYVKRSGQAQAEQAATYDSYGNLIALAKNGITRTLSANPATNRLTAGGATYTSNGELASATVDGLAIAYDYDSLGQQLFQRTQTKTWVFAYDANDERVLSWECALDRCGAGTNLERYTLRGLGGEVLRTFEGPSRAELAWKEDYIYRDGQALSWVKPDENGAEERFYLHADHLGSTRQITNQAGAQVARHDFLPFGEESTATTSGDVALKFTGHERDQTGKPVDYMHARFCSPVLGRFLRVDPSQGSARLPAPQTWNRYAAVNNNPLKFVDPNGRAAIFFVVAPSSHDIKSSFGHAAFLATSGQKRASVSRGTAIQLSPNISGFINEYLAEGRTVTAFVLKNDPTRDSKLVDKAQRKFPNYQQRRENCVTACGDALRAGEVLGKDQRPERGLLYDSPERLQDAFETGPLKDHVERTIVFDPRFVQKVTPEQILQYFEVPDAIQEGVDR